MHARRLDKDNAAARLYGVLRQRPGQRIAGPELARAAATDPRWPLTALSTCVAEVRAQLPPNERIDVARVGGGFYYALTVEAKGASNA